MSSVSVPLIVDVLAEGENETFNLTLNVPSSLGPAITAGGRNRATGVIIDTTSECTHAGFFSYNNVLCSASHGVWT